MRTLVSALTLVALAVGGCIGLKTESVAPVEQTTPGRWIPLAPLPAARQEVAVAAMGGRVWVVGGFSTSAEPLAIVESYDPVQNLWEPRASLPIPLHHPAAAVVGDRLFVLGGYTGGRLRWTPSDAVYEYIAARDAWEARAPMPTARGALAATVLNGRIHALGGSVTGPSNAHEVYDPGSNQWSVANAMPTARDHLAAVTFQGRVWALGGRTSFFGDQFANVEIYDAATDSWRTGPPLPSGRGGLAAATLPDRIVVFGGEAPFRIFSATEVYEASRNRWIAKEPMLTPRHGMGAAVIDDRIYVAAGATQPGFAATIAHEAYAP